MGGLIAPRRNHPTTQVLARDQAWAGQVIRLATALACVTLSACTTLRIEGLDAKAVDAAFDAEHAHPSVTRAACPRLAGDYAVHGVRQAARGQWIADLADLATVLQWQRWTIPPALADGAPRVRVRDAADAGESPSLHLQAISAAGAPIGDAVALGAPVPPPGMRARACLDGRLLLRTDHDWWNGGETRMNDLLTVAIQPLPEGLEVSVDHRRTVRGGLLFPITTRERASSRTLFERLDPSTAWSPD
ncbi:hypothetical protein [Luteimonas terrae]|uniref:Lipoprotein n=1 Tax=Luteimonas terrae TaxID=1530191 RepID=A0ABU1XSG1_9GAMM|nr:hypothetical protein [Luteimonas terrae]MDR7191694.1 hypothetical protein [Luteimonas terrae]